MLHDLRVNGNGYTIVKGNLAYIDRIVQCWVREGETK